MTHGSLFSGIGGFDLGAHWLGWDNLFHCEKEEVLRRVLKYYWPKAKSYEDIKNTDFTVWRGRIDVLSGGFPCQPHSLAGKRKGKEDDRHLWPEMLRAIREIAPSYIVGENVYGIVTSGGGLVFEEVHAQMEAEGYETISVILPVVAKDAPHRRDRVFFISRLASNTCSNGSLIPSKLKERLNHKQNRVSCDVHESLLGYRTPSNANDPGLEVGIRSDVRSNGIEKGKSQGGQLTRVSAERSYWEKFPTVSPIHSRDDGISSRLDGLALHELRSEGIKAAGNAVSPQVAYEIFKTIECLEVINRS